MGNIRVIGSRSAGKTTYLAALANFGKRGDKGKKGKEFSITPVNDEAKKLLNWAEDILEQGGRVAPTDAQQEVDELPDYLFSIKGKKGFKSYKIDLNVKDYSGEIFERLGEGTELDPKTQEYIDNCLMKDVSGCLIMLTAWEKGEDRKFKRALDNFIKQMDSQQRVKDLKLAVVMSKCERGEIWPGRIEPKTDLFGVHLPSTKELLEERLPAKNLGFFALSAFGVLGKNDPRPNRISELGKERVHAVLRDPDHWTPYNLIEPLYWLSGV